MPIRLSSIDFSCIEFFKTGAWNLDKVPLHLIQDIIAYRIHAVPTIPGESEQEWRRYVPEMISALQGDADTCFIWARGPMEWDGLPRVFPYMVRGDNKGNRYHINGLTSFVAKGYETDWISFEFSKLDLKRMMEDEFLDLEMTWLNFLIFEEKSPTNIFTSPFDSIGWDWVIAHSALVFSFRPNADSCDIFGIRERLTKKIHALTQTLREEIT